MIQNITVDEGKDKDSIGETKGTSWAVFNGKFDRVRDSISCNSLKRGTTKKESDAAHPTFN